MYARYEKKLAKWFLTQSGSEMAKAELEKRLEEENNYREDDHE